MARCSISTSFDLSARDASSAGPGITRRKDPRITRVGDLLRSWRIDEIPQLINVFLGEMSIVGPRPESPVYVAHYTAEQRRVLDIRPGMVSPTFLKYSVEEEILAVAGANSEEIYLSEVLPDKLRIEMAYVEQHTFWGDMSLLLNAEISLFRTAIQRARSNKHELAN